MTSIMRFRMAILSMATLAIAGCALDRPSGPTLLNPNADDLMAAAKNGGGSGKGGGGGDTGFGNNLSVPVIFAEGRGLTGAAVMSGSSKVFANTGLRPTVALDTAALTALTSAGTLPFWWSGNAAAANSGTLPVYWQKTANVWQAQWDGRTTGATPVVVDWGDNFRSVSFATTSVIRVEHVLNAADGTMMLGYPHDIVVNPSSPTELQGILKDGNETATVMMTPTVFSDRARLTLQKLSGQGGSVTYTYFDKAVYESFGVDGPGGYGAELNVGGKLVFGYVWDMKKVVMPGGITKDGWWRITFSLDAGTGATITGVGAGDEALVTFTPTKSVAEILIGTNRGGGRQ